jgi:hypothetical protein
MIQFVSILNLIQMNFMKVIHMIQNMINQEFQHFVEFQLIEVKILKMHVVSFISILNLIQMNFMKVIHMIPNMINQEFQHLVESQLIEVKKMKMHLI